MRRQITTPMPDGHGPSTVSPADDALEMMLRGLGGQICPSATGYLERLIDRQAVQPRQGARP